MEKITYQEMAKAFRLHENTATDGSHITGCIVFTESSFAKKYPLKSRTYSVSSNNKAYQPGMGGYSIFGSCLDGTDPIVRLDYYMRDEKGGKDGWEVEYCYLD